MLVRLAYNDTGQVQRDEFSSGWSRWRAYDESGQLGTLVDNAGHKQTLHYDGAGQVCQNSAGILFLGSLGKPGIQLLYPQDAFQRATHHNGVSKESGPRRGISGSSGGAYREHTARKGRPPGAAKGWQYVRKGA